MIYVLFDIFEEEINKKEKGKEKEKKNKGKKEEKKIT